MGSSATSLTWRQIAADQTRVNPPIQGRRVQGDQPSFPVAGHTYFALVPMLSFEPVHQRQYFLNLVADQMPSHLVSLPVEPFTVRHVGHPGRVLCISGLPEKSLERSMRVGITTTQPVSASRRANWDCGSIPSASPATCSGV